MIIIEIFLYIKFSTKMSPVGSFHIPNNGLVQKLKQWDTIGKQKEEKKNKSKEKKYIFWC